MKTTIRRKLLISIIVFTTLLYIITGLATGVYVRSLLVEQADRNNRQVLAKSVQQLDVILQLGEMTARQVMTDTDIEDIAAQARRQPESQKYIILSRSGDVLGRYIALNPFVANIMIFTQDNLTLSNQWVLLSDHYRSREHSQWFLDFTAGDERSLVSAEHTAMAAGNTQSVVTLAYKYRMLSQPAPTDNYLMIDIPVTAFREKLELEGAEREILVVNDYGQTISPSNLLSADELAGQENRDGIFYLKDTIALYERMDDVGWNLYYPIPKSEFNGPITTLMLVFAGLYGLVLVISILLLSRRIDKIIEPVHRITATMQAAYKGNLNVYIDEHSGDEFEILSNCFNKLTADLKRHIQQIVEEEQAKKEMQMDLMMSQIHPHFIYNTLNSAVYLIEEEQSEDAIETIYSLINILQSAVRIADKEIFATVAEELELVGAYAQIAAVRYPGMFKLEIKCEEGLERESIPKVLIQPLVENAIYHGIIPSGRPGHVWVTVKSDKSMCIDISVEDDGAGMEPGRLPDRDSRKSIHGVGLLNIRSRIDFLYNAVGHEFKISPRENGGTKISVRLQMDGPSRAREN